MNNPTSPITQSLIGRRALLGLLAAPAALAVLQACGSSKTPSTTSPSSSTSTTTSPSGTGNEARSGAARVSADPALARGAATAINELGVDLYSTLAKDNTENLVFSSASVMLALGMTRTGANGTTGTEMDTVLHASETGTERNSLHRSLNSLSAALESRSGEFTVDAQTLPVELAIANSLWGQDGVNWVPAFLDLLASEYGAGMRLVDYGANPEAARIAINKWVAVQTKDRIPELLTPGSITPDAVLTLVNAIYLKAPWLVPFEASATKNGPFTNADGSTTQVPVMTITEEYLHAQGDGWQAVELPYVGGSLAMTLVVPDAGRLADIEQRLGDGLLDTVVATSGKKQVTLGLPRFDIETKVQLAEVMAALGMPTAFDPNKADFSGMTLEQQLYIGLIIHQANITVDEKGTEAAAATAVVIRATSAPSDQVSLVIDRPFLYAVRDVPTGAVLFLGRVSKLKG